LDKRQSAVVKINSLRGGLFIDAELLTAPVGIQMKATALEDVDATVQLRRRNVHQFVVDYDPRALKALFVAC
jgi:hypothetical protein